MPTIHCRTLDRVGALVAVITASCAGAIAPQDTPAGSPGGAPGLATPADPGGGGGTPMVGIPGGGGSGASASDRLSWPVSYDARPAVLHRLSRNQIVATLRLLTGKAPDPDDLPEDPRPLEGVIQTGGPGYTDADLGRLDVLLRGFSTDAAANLLARSRCADLGQAQRDCLLAWAVRFREEALRRPMRPIERDLISTKLLPLAGTDRTLDLEVVESIAYATFFSPSFLYRAEYGTPLADRPGVGALDPLALASRLSFAFANTPPDAALRAAAAWGALQKPDERVKHLDRLLATTAGKGALVDLVLEFFGSPESSVNGKLGEVRSGLPTDISTKLRASAEQAVMAILQRSPDPALLDFFTATTYLADEAVKRITTAGVVKINGKDTAFGDVPATGRVGLPMHPHVLASHTNEGGIGSPFKMGMFLRKGFLCEPIPEPPADAAEMVPAAPAPSTYSTRQELVYRTEQLPTCKACHSTFSPLGYAFLPYDPLGRYIHKDPRTPTLPWDLAGKVPTYSGTDLSFTSPGDLTSKLGTHAQVRGCFAGAALTWALGHGRIDEDQGVVKALDAGVRRGDGIISLLRTLVAHERFAQFVAQR